MIWTHNLSPYIFRVNLFGNDFGPRWYGLAYVLGFVFGFIALRSAIRAGKLGNLKESHLEGLMMWLIAGVVLGGRLGYCLQNIPLWLKDPLYFFKFNQGGMAFFGGLAGVVLVLLVYSKSKKMSFAALGDVVAVPGALGLGIGRIANFINGELWGIPTRANWGVIFPDAQDGVPRHPSTVYEMITHFALAGLLAWAGKQVWAERRGVVSSMFVLVYGLLRVITEPFRQADTYLGPLTNGQVASLIIAIIGGIALVTILRKPIANVETESDDSKIYENNQEN